MSERTWSIGKVAAIATIVLAIVAVMTFLRHEPSSQLVADIRPMAFRLPLTTDQLAKLTHTDKPIDEGLTHLLEVSRAMGLVKIDLHNDGDLPISGIRINVDQAMAYAIGKEGVDDSSVLPSDQSGITLPNLTQGTSITIYV